MTPHSFRNASEFDLETLARLYTRTFEGYVMKAIVTPKLLETWIRVEDLKLELSPVVRVREANVGFATVGLRGRHAYCRGFGIVPEHRGRGLANALSKEMVARARNARATDMVLGVLVDNTGAIKSYRAGGFEPVRELHSVEWRGEDEFAREHRTDVAAIEPARALLSFDALHGVPSVWNRDLQSLEKSTGLQGLAVQENGAPCAYVLYRINEDRIEILDLAARRTQDAEKLLCALQSKFTQIVCYNEPEPSPAHAAFRACGFRVTHRRYEMRVGGLN